MIMQSVNQLVATSTQQAFCPPKHDFTMIDIRTVNAHTPKYHAKNVKPSDLLNEVVGSSGTGHASLSFQLVATERTSAYKIRMHHDTFNSILDSYHISKQASQLVYDFVHGFYIFSPSIEENQNYQTFYANNISYMLLWSFHITRRTSRALLIYEENHGDPSDLIMRGVLGGFQSVLEPNRHMVDRRLFLPVACAVQAVNLVQSKLSTLLQEIRVIEIKFGFSHRRSLKKLDLTEIDVDTLTELTRYNAASLVRIEDVKRRLKLQILPSRRYSTSC
jgi:hypothetical protein